MFIQVNRVDQSLRGEIILNSNSIVRAKSFYSANRDQSGTEIRLANGEVIKVSETLEELNKILGAVKI